MNNAQAKFILQSYRADGSDARDPAFQEALEQAHRDPSLAQWLDTETKLDTAVGAKLRECPVPPGLLDDLLAARKVHARPAFWTRRNQWVALAAGLALVVGAAWVLRPAPALSFAAYSRAATDYVNGLFQLELHTRSLTDLQAWMRSKGAASDMRIPQTLAAAVESGVGCKAFQWRGQSVKLICFTLEGGRPAHFFVMNVRGLPDAPSEGSVLYAQRGKWSTATWTSGDQAFVLATTGGQRDVEALL